MADDQETGMADEAVVEYHLSSFPPLLGPVTLLVGVEEDPAGGVRAYLGARWKRIYLHVTDPEAAEQFRHAWGNALGHTWLWPTPPPDMLTKEAPDN